MDLEDEGQGLMAGLVFGGAGLLMLFNIWSGEAEIVHRGGASRALGAILGDNAFLVLTCVVCLLLGGKGLHTFASGFLSDSSAGDSSSDDSASEVGDLAEAGAKHSRSAAIRFSCPHCGETSRIPAKYLGRRGKCPKCRAEVEVPAELEG